MGINDFPMTPPKSVERQLAEALAKIEKYKAVIREYRRRDLDPNIYLIPQPQYGV